MELAVPTVASINYTQKPKEVIAARMPILKKTQASEFAGNAAAFIFGR